MEDHIVRRIDEMYSDLKEIKADLKITTLKLYDDTTALKISQQKCDNHWSLIRNIIGFGGLGTLALWLSKFFTG